ERLAVDDAIAIALEGRTHVVFGLGAQPPARIGALGGLRRQDVTLPLLQLLSKRHSDPSIFHRGSGIVCCRWRDTNDSRPPVEISPLRHLPKEARAMRQPRD